jgi:UTP-glucose-1-phosphate uridylyltransferase/mevalonate kinase
MKLFVPGRICLFGEHSDWAGGHRRTNSALEKGYTLICGTDQGIYADVSPHSSRLVLTSTTPEGERIGPHEIPMDKEVLLREAREGGFFSYAAGVAYDVMTNYHVRGLRIDNYKTDLPVKKGLSSSAAICVLTARAFNRVYDLKMTTRGEMECAYRGEVITPSRCGRMDQGCAFGNRPILMIFDGDHLEVVELRVKRDVFLVIVDLCAGKNTQEILGGLNRCYPFARTDLEKKVQEYLGSINSGVLERVKQAIVEGDAKAVGGLMTEAQRLFDEYVAPACPSQLEAPVLHKVLSYEPIRDYIWGGKGVGSQGDGSAQFVARDEESQEKVVEVIERELNMPCLKLCLRAGSRVRKAVIPAAGFGTRLFPASKAVKKELFPIVDKDGMAKPAILMIVEEALRSGIEEVCIVVQESDMETFSSFFHTQVSVENYNKLPTRFREYSEHVLEVGRRVTLVAQDIQEGFGHAVYSAREWVGDEPFLLMLGDHLYFSETDEPCARQLLNIFDEHQLNVVGLLRATEDEIGMYGTVTGNWQGHERILSITEFAEKPSLDYARTNLRVEGLGENEYLRLSGQYVLKPQIFEYLAENISSNVRDRGEFQLTPCLDRLRREDGFLGYLVQGLSSDVGFPENYLRTLRSL